MTRVPQVNLLLLTRLGFGGIPGLATPRLGDGVIVRLAGLICDTGRVDERVLDSLTVRDLSVVLLLKYEWSLTGLSMRLMVKS